VDVLVSDFAALYCTVLCCAAPYCTALQPTALHAFACFHILQDSHFLQTIPEGSCRDMIYEYQKLAAQDVRFDVPLADACRDDRIKLCGNIQPVRALFLGAWSPCSLFVGCRLLVCSTCRVV
jgi:hypothetical protein